MPVEPVSWEASEGARTRWCGPEAAPVVLAITRAAFAGQEDLDPPSSAMRETEASVRADLEAGRGVLVGQGGFPVAVARTMFFDDHLLIRRVAVVPELRRRGIATGIMTWLHRQADDLGYRYTSLGVRKALGENRRLYERLGYHEVADNGFWVEMRRDMRTAHERS